MCNGKDDCKQRAQTEYKKRHDKVAQLIHWNLCKKYELDHARNWYAHTAEKLMENEKVKVLWDFTIQTDDLIQARRPAIIVMDKGMDHT